MHHKFISRLVVPTTALCVLLTTGAGNGGSAHAAEQKQQRSLIQIAERASKYAKCDHLRLLEKAACLREFAGKAVKAGAGTALFFYATQNAMKDQGARFGSLNKELKALKDLKLAELRDPAKGEDAKHQEDELTHAVRAFRAAKPHLEQLGSDIARADRLMGAQSDSLLVLSILTVALSDRYPEPGPVPPVTEPVKPLFDWDKDLKELNAAFDQMNAGFAQMDRGLKEMNEGVDILNKGLKQANAGIAKANRGMEEMNKGIAQANRGMAQANKAVPGIKKGAEKLREVSSIDFDFSHIGDTWGSGSSGLDDAEQQRRLGLILDLVPGIGDGKGIVEALTGKDMATGEELGAADRALGALVVLRWLKVGGKVLKAEDVRDARKGEGVVACLVDSSFLPGTPVLLADGTRVPIEEIEEGDLVLASDPDSGRTGPAPVTDLISTEGEKHLVRITVDAVDAEDDRSVTATENHPFRTEHPDQWTDAADLRPGMWLRTDTGAPARITDVTAFTARHQKVHNLTVADLHTYHVLVGGSAVLVHNAKKTKCELVVDHVGQVDQDWVTKGAHVNMKDGMEVALRPDGKGGITGEAIRLKKGTATQKQVDAVVAALKSDPKLRADMIRVTKGAKEVFESSARAMKEGRNPQWRFSNDRTKELQALIDAMEKM
ncbi:polymorphic toxin-type HINT domain-containing protein [Streptomyces cinereoruber]|uniref:polymorphic toxin-type HINT domain-containing protein n=1 Tax=Streptomyces cinereoruber TaxID=67260 RepID=UPI003BF54AE9